MDIRAIISVGNFTTEAHVEDCGPDALADAMRQVITATLTLCGADAVTAAAGTEATEAPDGD